MTTLTQLRRLHANHQLARAALPPGGNSQFVQLYGPPNAETPLLDFQTLAANAYGATGYVNSTFGASGSGGNAIVFALIDRRMSVFTEAKFKFRSLTDKHLYGTPALSVLENPWPDATTGDLLARMEQDASLGGNAYIRRTGLDEHPLERLRPDWVTIVSKLVPDGLGGAVRQCIGFWYDPLADGDRQPEFYPVDEVAHWAPIPDPLAQFRGMSWLTPVIRELSADIRMNEYRQAFFQNAATPNVVIKYSSKIAPERVERLQRMLKTKHTGIDGAFGTLVLDEGADLMVVGASMEGAAFDTLQAAGETRLCMAAGVPAIVAGARQGLQASQVGEYQQASRQFADLKMRPLWRSACAALAKLVAVPGGAELWYDTTDVSALQEGEQDKAATLARHSETINKLIMAGFEPDSVIRAVVANDLTLLVHTGLVSVQMQKLEDKMQPAVNVVAGPAPGQLTTATAPPVNGSTPQLATVGS